MPRAWCHGAASVVVPAAQPGQPAALLQRRPDLLAFKAQLDAANARRRQAKAEWFPRLFLGALFGGQSVELNDFDLGATRFSLAAGLLAMPVFNAGRTRAINEIAASGQSEALIRYEDGIVRALEDVENALVALRDERQRAESLQTAAAAADAALGRAQSLYDRGQIDLLPLLDAQRPRLPCGSARTTATPSCCSTACSCTRRSAAAGRCSSLPSQPPQPAPRLRHTPDIHCPTEEPS